MVRRVFIAVSVLLSVLVLGTVGYMIIGGWSLLDALYMTVITVATVGFREVRPLTPVGQLFTIGLVLVGVGALGYSFATFVEFLVEGHLRGLLEERRMRKVISNLSDHHIIAGLGRVGSVVARALNEEGARYVAIDTNEEALLDATGEGAAVIKGDATDESVLVAAGVERARSLITTLDSDADNLFVTLTARGLNPRLFIVARSSAESTEAKLRKAGADRVLTPTVIGGRRMATMVLHPVVSDYLDLVTRTDKVEFRLEEMALPAHSMLAGRSLADLGIRERTGAYVLAVHTSAGGINTNPSADTVLHANDRIVVLGTPAQLEALTAEVEARA